MSSIHSGHRQIRNLCIVLSVFLLSILTTAAQTFDEFEKQIDEDFAAFEKKTDKIFDDYVKKIDQEFADYLAANFKEYTLQKSEQKKTGPKPDKVPRYTEIPEKKREEIKVTGTAETLEENKVILPVVKKQGITDFETRKLAFGFFGTPLKFVYDVNIIAPARNILSAGDIAAYWEEMSKTWYNPLLDQLDNYRQVLNLNDWAYYQMIRKFSATAYPDNENMQNLLTWFMLTRSGYKNRIAFGNLHTYVLISSVYPLAGSYVRLNNINYYLPGEDLGQAKTYAKDFPQADRILDMSISKPMNLAEKKVDKPFHFNHGSKDYEVSLSYNQNLIDFYNTCPLADLSLYFNSVPGPETKNSVLRAFRPLITGKSKIEAANLLLSFVQQAFAYKTDQDAYGKEKYMFADELLHYPYADCEDRSVLYAYLVRTLLNLEVTGLTFPGHVATAVHFLKNPPGEYISYARKEFVIADPTFTGAPVGMLMPGINKSEAEIIEVKQDVIYRNKAAEIWDVVRKYGGYRGDVLQDVVFAPSGNAYVCGYFVKKANFRQFHLASDFEGRDMFIAKFDPALNPVWVKTATGPGNDMAYSIALDPRGILYVYGSFEESLNFGGQTIEATGAPDVFVTRYAPNGDVRWVTKAGIDKVDHSANFMFSAVFNPAGQKTSARLYNETKNFDFYGLNLDGNGNAVITGSFYATTGLNTTDFENYNFGSEFNIPNALYDTSYRLHSKLNYERTIAGLFAALRLIRFNSFELKGSALQSTIEKHNQPFIEQAADFYKNMGKMKFVINNTGIVVINTEQRAPVDFGFIRINNNARLKVIIYENGNSKLDILSGIEVVDPTGEARFDMNSVSLSKEKGDLLLDYDDDHTKIQVNLKEDLLHLN